MDTLKQSHYTRAGLISGCTRERPGMNKAWDVPATVFILSDKGSICERQEGFTAGM